MQTRSTRLSSNPAFLEQYDRRRIRDAQNARKRTAADTPTNTDQSRLTRAEAAAARQLQREFGSGSRQQQQRGQRTEQKEDNVIVLDDEESSDEEDNVPLQQKRRRLNSSHQPATSTVDTVALRPNSNARTADSHPATSSPRLPPRRALLSGLPAYISTLVSSSLNYISSPFTSKVTHYTRQRNQHATRSTRVNTNSSFTHTLSDGRWHNTADGREEAAQEDEDERAIDRTFRVISDSDFQDSTPYLTYPPNNPRYSITLTYGDLHRLNPNEFLNDTLIEFYLLYIRDRVVPARLRGRFHFFNSFLFTRLSEFGVGGVRAVYDHVKGWTKGVNLFEKDWIVMPINDADRHHWSLVIIAHPGRAMRPNGTLGIDAALTADRAKQRQQQQAGSGARQAGSRLPGRSAGGEAGAQQRTKAATPSPAETSLPSNPRQPRNGTTQQSIPDLFASQGSTPPSSLLALASPPLTIPKQQTTKPPRSLRQRSHGEQLAVLAQQQQQTSSGKRATRQNSHDPLMSPENETTRRLTESKGNIRADMNGSPYSKRSRPADFQQRRQEEQWQRALAVPDEQPIIADTQSLEMDEEQTEEKSAPSPAVKSAASSADSVLPTQLYDDEGVEGPAIDVGEVDEDHVPLIQRASSNEKSKAEHEEADQHVDMDHQNGQSAQQAADGNDDDPNIEIEADEPDADIPILPRITDSVPPTLPLPPQPTSSSSPSSKPSKSQPSTSEPAEAGWRPCILHFDSLRIPPYQTKRIANVLREYLQCEWEHQQHLHHTTTPQPPPPPPPNSSLPHYSVPLAATRHFTDKTFPHYDVDVPQQPNDYDCGVYILHFAELFCAEPWQDVRRLDREGWLTSRMERGGDKRVAMRELVDQLHGEEEFEKVRLLSVQEMKREVEQKQRDSQQKQQQQQQALHKQQVEWDGKGDERHKDLYVPDSDDEEDSEQRKGKDGRVDNGARRRVGGRLSSSGQRVLGGDDIEGGSGGLSSPVNRSISFVVPSSQPAEDEDYEPQ